MGRFWEIVFCVPLLFRRNVCLFNSKHGPSRKLPLTARETVFSRLNAYHFPCLVTDVAARSVDDGFTKTDSLAHAHYQIQESKTRGGCTYDSSEELKLDLTY